MKIIFKIIVLMGLFVFFIQMTFAQKLQGIDYSKEIEEQSLYENWPEGKVFIPNTSWEQIDERAFEVNGNQAGWIVTLRSLRDDSRLAVKILWPDYTHRDEKKREEYLRNRNDKKNGWELAIILDDFERKKIKAGEILKLPDDSTVEILKNPNKVYLRGQYVSLSPSEVKQRNIERQKLKTEAEKLKLQTPPPLTKNLPQYREASLADGSLDRLEKFNKPIPDLPTWRLIDQVGPFEKMTTIRGDTTGFVVVKRISDNKILFISFVPDDDWNRVIKNSVKEFEEKERQRKTPKGLWQRLFAK